MTKEKIPKISKRLEAAASFYRTNASVIDVGTDHAYLPIYLCMKEGCPSAVAADIKEGPLSRARENVALHALESKISLSLTDGLHGIERQGALDIFILGMGGELISKIISDAEWVKKDQIRLILQPMTRPETVRAFLVKEGFEIKAEKIVLDDKLYQIIVAEYSGIKEEYNELELLFGRLNIKSGSREYFMLLEKTKGIYLERQRGKAVCGADDSEEKAMLKAIDDLMLNY